MLTQDPSKNFVYTPSTGIDLNTPEGLLALAQARGGSVETAATEIMHPQTGILSTIGNGFKNTFSDLIDIVSTPAQAVSGLLHSASTGENALDSINSAMSKNISVSDELFKGTMLEATGSDNWAVKAVKWTPRFAVDVFTDPTTYLTFGAGSVSKQAVKILNTESVAIRQAVEKQAMDAGLTGSKKATFIEQEYTKALDAAEIKNTFDIKYLNKEGIDLATKRLQSMRDGASEDFFRYAADELVTSGSAKNIDEARNILKNDFMGDAAQEALRKTLNRRSILTPENIKLDEALIRSTLEAPIKMADAVETLGKMLSVRPALMETLVEKGGIYFFKRSILSAQRIEAVTKLIPGTKFLDMATKPARDLIGRAFNPNHISEFAQGDPREAIQFINRYKDLAQQRRSDAIELMPRVYRELGISKEEADLITSTIEERIRPADPKMAALWDIAHGLDYNKEALPNAENVLRGMRFVQGENKRNLQSAWNAGIRVSKQENYMMHMTDVKTVAKNYKSSPNSVLKQSKMAEVSTFENLRNLGDRVTGIAKDLGFSKFSVQKEQEMLAEKLKVVEEKYGLTIGKLNENVFKIQTEIQKVFEGNLEDKFLRNIVDNIQEKKGADIQSALRVFRESLPKVNFEQLKNKYEFAKQNAIKAVGDLREQDPQTFVDAMQRLMKENERVVNDVPGFAENLNRALYSDSLKGPIGIVKTAEDGKGVITAEAKEMLDKLRKINKDYSDEILRNAIPEDQMSMFMNKMVDEFESNPTGVKHLLNSLIGKENKVKELLTELSDKRVEIMRQMDETGEMIGMDGQLFRSKKGEIYRRQRATITEAESAGFQFERSSLSIMMHASMNTVKSTTMKEMIDGLASRFAFTASEAPPGYREVQIKGLKEEGVNLSKFLTGDKGEALMFHPEVAKRLENFMTASINDDVEGVMKGYDKMTNIIKASLTSIFPAFHGRNAISNVFSNFLDIGKAALNPANHVMSAQLIKKQRQLERILYKASTGDTTAKKEMYSITSSPVFTDRTGHTWTFGELQAQMKRNGIAFGNSSVGPADLVKTGTQKEVVDEAYNELFGMADLTGKELMIAKTKKGLSKINPLDVDKNVFYLGGRTVGSFVEDQARIINFIENLRNTGDVEIAASRTKQFLFDYGHLTEFERKVLKRIIPFYAWTRKNLELQVRVLLSEPGKTASTVKAVNSISDYLGQSELTKEEKDLLPKWMQSSLTPVVKRDGSTVWVYSKLGTPIEAAFQALNPSQFLSSINPMLKLPVELMSGYNFYRGGKLSEINNGKAFRYAPESIKSLVGYQEFTYKSPSTGKTVTEYVALNPKAAHFLLNLPPTSRIWNEVDTQISMYKDGSWSRKTGLLHTLIGVDESQYDLEYLAAARNKEKKKELEDLLDKAGIGYTFKKFIYNDPNKITKVQPPKYD